MLFYKAGIPLANPASRSLVFQLGITCLKTIKSFTMIVFSDDWLMQDDVIDAIAGALTQCGFNVMRPWETALH